MSTVKQPVNVAAFRTASADYLKRHIDLVNTSKVEGGKKDIYLTKAEAKKLPKDLQDNFARYQSKIGNHQVRISAFEKSYAGYVRAKTGFANKNHDAVLAPSETKYLPNDLRNNLVAFAKFKGLR